MKISKTHQRFSDNLNEPRALTNPEDYLGPNWRDVINFWFYIDTISEVEELKMNFSYFDLDFLVRADIFGAARDAAKEVVGWKVATASWFASSRAIFGDATRELIAHHKLLEQDKTLVALPLCLKP
jgi:hypothetical protein